MHALFANTKSEAIFWITRVKVLGCPIELYAEQTNSFSFASRISFLFIDISKANRCKEREKKQRKPNKNLIFTVAKHCVNSFKQSNHRNKIYRWANRLYAWIKWRNRDIIYARVVIFLGVDETQIEGNYDKW